MRHRLVRRGARRRLPVLVLGVRVALGSVATSGTRAPARATAPLGAPSRLLAREAPPLRDSHHVTGVDGGLPVVNSVASRMTTGAARGWRRSAHRPGARRP